MTAISHDHMTVSTAEVVGTNTTSAGDLSGTMTSGHDDITFAITDDTAYYMCVAMCVMSDMPAAGDTLPTLH